MNPEHPEEDEFLEDDEAEEYGQRSIFATGWFRAVLVLLVLAVIAVIAVPLIGGWFEPTPPPKTASKPSEPPSSPPPALSTPPPTTAPATPPAAQEPSTTPAPPAPAPATPPAVRAPTPAPPAAMTTLPRAEMPASTPSTTASEKPAEKTKPPKRVATTTPAKTPKPAASGGYWVQVGAFKESRNAEGLARKLRTEGFPVQVAQVTRDGPFHVVRVGGYPDRSKAAAARQELQGKGHAGFVTQGPAK